MITFKELEANYESVTAIPYFELIKTKEWFDCREIIIKRDGCRCTKCGRTSTIAHFDNKSRKTIHIWITEGKTIRAENIGIDIDLDFPEIKVADKYYTLHVHHTLYILEKLPWEYKPEELIKVLTTTDIVASVIDYDPVSLAISLASKAKSELIPSAD